MERCFLGIDSTLDLPVRITGPKVLYRKTVNHGVVSYTLAPSVRLFSPTSGAL